MHGGDLSTEKTAQILRIAKSHLWKFSPPNWYFPHIQYCMCSIQGKWLPGKGLSNLIKLVPYSRKFSRGQIFVVFADDHPSMKIKPTKKLNCTIHNGRECLRPQKLNLWNSKDRPSTKIEPRENFPLYGNIVPHMYIYDIAVMAATKNNLAC